MPTFCPFSHLCSKSVTWPTFIMVISIFFVSEGDEEGVNGASPSPGNVNSTNWPVSNLKVSYNKTFNRWGFVYDINNSAIYGLVEILIHFATSAFVLPLPLSSSYNFFNTLRISTSPASASTHLPQPTHISIPYLSRK